MKHLFLFFTLALFTTSLRVDKSETLNTQQNFPKQIETFSFFEGGTVNISVTLNNKALVNVWLCEGHTESYDRLRNLYCNKPDCTAIPTNGSIYSSTTRAAHYSLIAVNCDLNKDATLRFKYTFLNPGGEELARGDEIKPFVYFGKLIIWIGIIVFNLAYAIIGRRYLTPIHVLIFIVSFIRICFVASLCYYWSYYKNTGWRLDNVLQISKLFYIFSEGAYIFTIFVLSKGWRITRSGISKVTLRKSVGTILIMLCVTSVFSFVSPNYYLLSLLFAYFIIIPKIFSNITMMLRLLHGQATIYRNADPNCPHLVTIENKTRLARKIKITTSLYIVALVLVNVLKLIPMDYWPFGTHPSEFVLSFYILALSIIIRPRQDSGFIFSSHEIIPVVNIEQVVLNRIERNDEESYQPWDLNKTVLIEWPSKDGNGAISLGVEREYANLQKKI